ncbi:hypothetical protein IHE45_10G003000 [Dioscorea alata]|uniref:Uncharacterized protein n=1 Tax=Dioscorea alata TaxID=55571 RepID=A0ACB7V8W7_DIOAL|nr:hypothetical protein IHE45_10G003000 [Dioscorea alata]
MDLQSSPNYARKLWSHLQISMNMMRKRLISKRRLILDISLMVKKWRPMFHHHNHRRSCDKVTGGFGLHEYEFSCSNSPAIPIFFSKTSRKHNHSHNYLPCNIATSSSLQEEPEAPKLECMNDSLEDVDAAAEKFINKFYEQLRAQCSVQLLEYQELESDQDIILT